MEPQLLDGVSRLHYNTNTNTNNRKSVTAQHLRLWVRLRGWSLPSWSTQIEPKHSTLSRGVNWTYGFLELGEQQRSKYKFFFSVTPKTALVNTSLCYLISLVYLLLLAVNLHRIIQLKGTPRSFSPTLLLKAEMSLSKPSKTNVFLSDLHLKKNSSDRDSTTSPNNLFQYLAIIARKFFLTTNLNVPRCNLSQLFFVLSPVNKERS